MTTWDVEWSTVYPSLIDQLPYEAVSYIRSAFGVGGASSMTQFFNILNGKAAFTSPYIAEQNVTQLLRILNVHYSSNPAVVNFTASALRYFPGSARLFMPPTPQPVVITNVINNAPAAPAASAVTPAAGAVASSSSTPGVDSMELSTSSAKELGKYTVLMRIPHGQVKDKAKVTMETFFLETFQVAKDQAASMVARFKKEHPGQDCPYTYAVINLKTGERAYFTVTETVKADEFLLSF
jgi:hypothetical protein